MVRTFAIREEAEEYLGQVEKEIDRQEAAEWAYAENLIAENMGTDYCFTIQIGNKSLINRHKFENFLNQTTSI